MTLWPWISWVRTFGQTALLLNKSWNKVIKDYKTEFWIHWAVSFKLCFNLVIYAIVEILTWVWKKNRAGIAAIYALGRTSTKPPYLGVEIPLSWAGDSGSIKNFGIILPKNTWCRATLGAIWAINIEWFVALSMRLKRFSVSFMALALANFSIVSAHLYLPR